MIRIFINSFAWVLLLFSNSVKGDELIYLDNPSVVATLRPGGKVAAYYVGRSDQPYLFKPDGTIAICEFLIYGKALRDGSFEVKAWEPSLVPAPESRIVKGAIYIEDHTWTVNFDQVPNGCRSKKDGEGLIWRDSNYFMENDIPILYKQEQGIQARIVRRTPAIGIRIIQVRTAPVYNSNPPAEDFRPSFSISLGNLVSSIEQKKEYSKIEYIVPESGEKLSGWVRTKHLKDPFATK
jgi:hypothetical protein